jgi:hypothetical protein
VAENQKMAKKQKKFKDWYEDEWGNPDDVRKDGKRYNAKKEAVKQQRVQKSDQKNKFFEPRD